MVQLTAVAAGTFELLLPDLPPCRLHRPPPTCCWTSRPRRTRSGEQGYNNYWQTSFASHCYACQNFLLIVSSSPFSPSLPGSKKFGEVPMLHAVSHLQPPPLGPQPALPFAVQPSLEGLSLADGEPLDGHARLPARQAPDGRCAFRLLCAALFCLVLVRQMTSSWMGMRGCAGRQVHHPGCGCWAEFGQWPGSWRRLSVLPERCATVRHTWCAT